MLSSWPFVLLKIVVVPSCVRSKVVEETGLGPGGFGNHTGRADPGPLPFWVTVLGLGPLSEHSPRPLEIAQLDF